MNGGAAGRPADGMLDGALGTVGEPRAVGRGTAGAGRGGIASTAGVGATEGGTTRDTGIGAGARTVGIGAATGLGAAGSAGAARGAALADDRATDVAPADANSARASSPAAIVMTPPQTEQRARTLVSGTFDGSTRKIDRHSGQVTFMTFPQPARRASSR